ncbi:hypothetical protein JCM8202_005750 [Rhodotorula sphaerocarpa]
MHLEVMIVWLWAALLSPALAVLAAPTVTYPLQAQRPPLARTGTNWTFTLLPGTFSSAQNVSLAVTSKLPGWVTFDAAVGSFAGTPAGKDLGSTTVTVAASEGGGAASSSSSTSSSFTLLVVDAASDPEPVVKLPVSQQLAQVAAVSGGGTLTPDGSLKVPPKWSFSFGFQWYTISSPSGRPMYWTAYEKGTTSLPSWISFDNATVTFNGLAPNPAQRGTWHLVLGASDVYGYADAWQEFELVVAEHSFELLGSDAADANGTLARGVLPAINATLGGPVQYSIALDRFRVDNTSLTMANLSSATADFARTGFGSSALQLDSNSSGLVITGTVPSNSSQSSSSPGPVEVTLVDKYNDTLTTNISIHIVPSLFDTSKFPATIGVKEGEAYSEDLSRFLAASSTRMARTRKRSLPTSLSAANVSLDVSPANASSWISLNRSSFTLSGTAPPSGPNATATLDIVDPSTGAISRAQFHFAVSAAGTGSTIPAAGSGGAGTEASSGGLSHEAKLGLGLGLGLGLPLLVALVVLLACCYRRRKGTSAGGASSSKRSSNGRTGLLNGLVISRPRPLSTGATSHGTTEPTSGFGASDVTVVTPSYEQERKSGEEKPLHGSPEIGTAWSMNVPTSTAPPSSGLVQARGADNGPQQAKRFDVMGMLFRSESGVSVLESIRRGKLKGKGKEAAPPVPALPQAFASSVPGLGLGGAMHDVIVVEEGGGPDERRRSTYREGAGSPYGSEGSVALAGGRLRDVTADNGSGRVSSWESGASSSLFYSSSASKSATGSTGPHRRTASRSQSLGSQRSFASLSSAAAVSAKGGRRGGAPSIPQRRRDFMPIGVAQTTAGPSRSSSDAAYDVSGVSMDDAEVSGGSSRMYHHDGAATRLGSHDPLDEIRIVGSHSGSTSGGSSEPFDDVTNRVGTRRAAHGDRSRSESFPASELSQHSLPPVPARFVPFPTSHQRSLPYGHGMPSQSSLAAGQREAVEPLEEEAGQFDDGANDDAWEEEDLSQLQECGELERPRTPDHDPAGAYYPSGSAYSRTSFDDSADSQRLSAGGVRYVGSFVSSHVSPHLPQSSPRESTSHYSREPGTPRSDLFSIASSQPTAATSHGPTRSTDTSNADCSPQLSWAQKRASSAYHEPLRVPVQVDAPFKFVPRLDPPPFASITSSPGRNGPPRATYSAWLDVSRLEESEGMDGHAEDGNGARAPLPDWIRFDPDRIEMHGRAGAADLGSWPVVVIERKALRTPGSPTRVRSASGADEATDAQVQVVGRFDVVVQAFDEYGQEETLHQEEEANDELRFG